MPVIRDVKAKQIDEPCPNCGQGFMRPNGIVNQTNPPQYEHICTNCGHKQIYLIRYPQYVNE